MILNRCNQIGSKLSSQLQAVNYLTINRQLTQSSKSPTTLKTVKCFTNSWKATLNWFDHFLRQTNSAIRSLMSGIFSGPAPVVSHFFTKALMNSSASITSRCHMRSRGKIAFASTIARLKRNLELLLTTLSLTLTFCQMNSMIFMPIT